MTPRVDGPPLPELSNSDASRTIRSRKSANNPMPASIDASKRKTLPPDTPPSMRQTLMRPGDNPKFYSIQHTPDRAERGCLDASPRRADVRTVGQQLAVRGSEWSAAEPEEMRLSRVLRAAATVRLRFTLAVCAAVLALGFSGCKTMDRGADIGHYEVSVKSTPFYSYWSGRSSAPDFMLPKGTHLVALKREFGFTRVVTDAGHMGYVTPTALTPTRPPQTPRRTNVNFAALQRLPWGGGRNGMSSANGAAVLQDGSLFGSNDLPPLLPRDPLQPGSFLPGFRISVPPRSLTEPVTEVKPPNERKPPAGTKPGSRGKNPTGAGEEQTP